MPSDQQTHLLHRYLGQLRRPFKVSTMILDLYPYDLCLPHQFLLLLEIMPSYHSWTLRSEPFSQYFCPPPFTSGVLVYRHPRSVNCSPYPEFRTAYSKYSSLLESMIVGVRKWLLLLGSPAQSLHFLCFLLPTPWHAPKDTVQQFGQQLDFKLFQGF